eukprot:SAG31_NODE_38443_length_296_cov_0.781726_1_plen_69_part_01
MVILAVMVTELSQDTQTWWAKNHTATKNENSRIAGTCGIAESCETMSYFGQWSKSTARLLTAVMPFAAK